MGYQSSHVQIFIGSPIAHGSERTVLDRLARSLADDRRPSLILANLSLGGHQLDFVVARDDLVLVIEAKSSTRPIRGGENGHWQIQGADGAWTKYRNPYLQARDAALALRDAMRVQTNGDVPYPSATVVFAPSIPPNSTPYKGDLKVRIIGLDELATELQGRRGDAWPLARWRDFALRHGLRRVTSPQMAWARELIDAQDLVEEYSAAFCRAYGGLEQQFVPIECHLDGQPLSSESVICLAARQEADILLRGPSGCGKSLLSIKAGLEITRGGGVVVILPARDYRGSLRLLLGQEAALLGAPSAEELLSSARRLNRPFLFILDGYNECGEQHRAGLARRLVGLVQKFEGRLLITSQVSVASESAVRLQSIEVLPPNDQAKLTIAARAAGGAVLTPEVASLAKTVTSGLEARLVGEVGGHRDLGGSRYALFDAFIRKRLGTAASDGIRALSLVAAWLTDRIAFSLSVRDMDRLADTEHVSSSLRDTLGTAGLLIQRGDRVSFAHEMFLHAFAAEAVIRRAAGEPSRVAEALATPRHDEHIDLIVGAIDDDRLLIAILDRVTRSKAVASCLSGVCGRHAKHWAENRCRQVLGRIGVESRKVAFKITDPNTWGVSFEKESLIDWSEQERAVLGVLPDLLFQEHYLATILEIIAAMDARMDEETRRLHGEARERKLPLRCAMFSSTYVSAAESTPGITHIFSRLHSGGYFPRRSIEFVQALREKLAADDISNGQLYLLLYLCRRALDDRIITAPLLARIIKRSFSSYPYHLQLELMETASSFGQEEERDRALLVEAIEAIPQQQHPFVSSTMVEALQSLGALDDSEAEQRDVVSRQLRQCLIDSDRPEQWEAAYGIYYAQFDHPLAGAYCDAVSALDPAERKQFLLMAAKGVDDSTFFLSPLISELASLGDPNAGAAISRWTALPPPDSGFYQDAVGVFVLAHVALGLLGSSLPAREATSNPSADALGACGEILYWANRVDLDQKARYAACEHALSVLARHEQGAAVDAILHCEDPVIRSLSRLSQMPHVAQSLVPCFPAQMAEACRQALLHPGAQVGYFRHFPFHGRDKLLMFSMSVLSEHGTVADLPLLRSYVDNPALASSVLAAVKQLESRLAAHP